MADEKTWHVPVSMDESFLGFTLAVEAPTVKEARARAAVTADELQNVLVRREGGDARFTVGEPYEPS